ncbi:MAG: fused MFS/spermidine synthase [Planctomycetales bacterium]|nr:fused MFS/spermidine synthase [Planctomycetales bacterium]
MARYALTIFVSAFLLFQVQPMIAKFVLPWFGGGPAIWTSCMLFFQTMLLGGYLYAHVISVRLSVRAQSNLHALLLLGSLVLLPIAPGDWLKPDGTEQPVLAILLLLLATVGGPYLLLSSTGPLMQRWFSHSFPTRSPYRLYALSNVGSMLALLTYPFLFEPVFRLRQQVWMWSITYGVFVASAIWCSRLVRNAIPAETADGPAQPAGAGSSGVAPAGEMHFSGLETPDLPGAPTVHLRPTLWLTLLWLGLSATGSAMLLATTNQMCIDVAVVPFLWVVPLALYLLTFVICFDNPRWYDRRVFGVVLVAAAIGACWQMNKGLNTSIPGLVTLYTFVLAACCMTCHGELVALRPDPRHLTWFYLMVSVGGAIGGLFVAVVAPAWFKGFWEYPIAVGAACLMTVVAWSVNRTWKRAGSLVFWCWCAAACLQMVAVLKLIYLPLEYRYLAGQAVWLLLGVGVIQVAGLMLVADQERRPAVVAVIAGVTTFAMVAWVAFRESVRSDELLAAGEDLPDPVTLRGALDAVKSLQELPVLGSLFQWAGQWSAMSIFVVVSVLLAAIAVCLPLILRQRESAETELLGDTWKSVRRGAWLAVAAELLAVGAIALMYEFEIGTALARLLTVGVFFALLIGGDLLAATSAKDSYFDVLWHSGALVFTALLIAAEIVGYGIESGAIEAGADAAGGGKGLLARLPLGLWPRTALLGGIWSLRARGNLRIGFANYLNWGAWFWSPVFAACVLLAGVLIEETSDVDDNVLHLSRNFYGVLQVSTHTDDIGKHLSLTHGQIEHGLQYEDEQWRMQPTTYYGPGTGVYLALTRHPQRLAQDPAEQNLRVAVIGLGTGSIAALAQPRDYFRFYEINPDVVALSDKGKFFTYLRDTPAKTEIALGDARVMMDRELETTGSQRFDVIVVDAFSSDAIPVHLLTLECADVYKQQLKSDGILAIHISNRFLDLNPVTKAIAEHLQWSVVRVDNDSDDATGVYGSTWILVTNNQEFLNNPEVEGVDSPWDDDLAPLPWTDDFASLWQVLSE